MENELPFNSAENFSRTPELSVNPESKTTSPSVEALANMARIAADGYDPDSIPTTPESKPASSETDPKPVMDAVKAIGLYTVLVNQLRESRLKSNQGQ